MQVLASIQALLLVIGYMPLPHHCWQSLVLCVQVLTSIQATHVMLHCEPEVPIKDMLFEFIAAKYGYESEEELVVNGAGVTDQDWNRAVDYFNSVSPYSPRQPWYVPIPQKHVSSKPASLTLY